jgi:hypothetical protein
MACSSDILLVIGTLTTFTLCILTFIYCNNRKLCLNSSENRIKFIKKFIFKNKIKPILDLENNDNVEIEDELKEEEIRDQQIIGEENV